MSRGSVEMIGNPSRTRSMTARAGGPDLKRLVARMVKHGATQVAMPEMLEEAQILWRIGEHDTLSETCIHAEEMMSSGARNSRRALDLMARMERTEGTRGPDLPTALKKYVEDTGEAIKQVDNALREKGSDLATLLFEIPDRSQDKMSWRDLIGRRDVIAHQLLTVDDQRIYREAKRDFGALHTLLSHLYFVPVKTNFQAGRGFEPMFKSDVIHRLLPAEPGTRPTIGQSLILVCEDENQGFIAFRMSRSASNRALFTGPPGSHHISVVGLTADAARALLNPRSET